MANTDWLNALKYGPIAIAALTAFWAAGLLTLELARIDPNVKRDTRAGARRLIYAFMVFALVMTAASFGLSMVDRWTNTPATDPRIAQIHTVVAQMDNEELRQMDYLLKHTGPDPVVVQISTSLCRKIVELYTLTGGYRPDGSCRGVWEKLENRR
jgi:hypothetical protein